MAPIGLQFIQSTGKTMFSRNSYTILQRAQYNIITKTIKYSTSTAESEINVSVERDPAPVFFNEDVQNLLKTLTRPEQSKIFRKRKDGQKIQDAIYEFMTDEQLQRHVKEAQERGLRRLQMPPVVKKRVETGRIFSKDPALQGHNSAKFVFTDITYPMNDYERLIVVREPDGVLRDITWDERHRINQLYYPMKDREIFTPRMFQDKYLQDLLTRKEYEYVLDRACLQFEPNEPEYHRVTEAVYTAVNKEMHFDSLRSTRHFGPLVFHLVWTKNIGNLLIENIRNEKLEDAVLLIKLYNKIYPEAKSAALQHEGDDIKYLQDYVNLEPERRGKLKMTLQTLVELLNARKTVEEGVKKAHGL